MMFGKVVWMVLRLVWCWWWNGLLVTKTRSQMFVVNRLWESLGVWQCIRFVYGMEVGRLFQ